MTYDEFIGRRKGLSDFLMRLVEKGVLFVPDAFKIQNQITDEYLSGVIDDDTLEDRLMSILLDYDEWYVDLFSFNLNSLYLLGILGEVINRLD